MSWQYEILNKLDEDCLDIAIHDQIGAADGKGVGSASVRDALKNSKAKNVSVNIHSAGGEVLDGLAIYNLLASHPAKVTVNIPTLAASIASVIAMAGDEVCIGRGAFMMVHCPYAQTKGGSDELRKLADVLDKMQDTMTAIYSKKTGKSKEEIEKLLEAETWMTGAEAVKHGFADKLTDGPKKAIAADSLKIYAKVPDEILEQLTRPDTAPAIAQSQAGEKMDENLKKALDEAFAAFEKKMDAKYGAKVEAKKDEKKNPFADDKEEDGSSDGSSDMPAGKAGKAQAEANVLSALVEANKMVAALNAKLEAQNKVTFEARVNTAITAGKLLPSQKAWAMTLDEESFDGYLAAVGGQVFPVGKEHREDEKTAKAHAEVATELTAEEKKLAKNMGISEAELAAYNKANPKA